MTGKNQTAPDDKMADLARRLMDLWQDQLTAIATNPDLASQAARLMAALPLPGLTNPAMAAGFGANPGGINPADLMAQWMKGMHGFGNAATTSPGAEKAGPAPAAAASGPGDVGLAELRGRLAELEGKLAELGGKSAKPATKPGAGKRRPAARRTRAATRPGEAGGTGGGAPG